MAIPKWKMGQAGGKTALAKKRKKKLLEKENETLSLVSMFPFRFSTITLFRRPSATRKIPTRTRECCFLLESRW